MTRQPDRRRRILSVVPALAAAAVLTAGWLPHARAGSSSGGAGGGIAGKSGVTAAAGTARMSGALRYAMIKLRRDAVRAGSSPGAGFSGARAEVVSSHFMVEDGDTGPRATFKAILDSGSAEEIAALRAAGADIRGHLGAVVSFTAPLDRADELARLASVRSLDIARRMRPELDFSVPDTGATAVRDPNFFGATGDGVLVAGIDTGHDLRHADFRNPDGTTRFKSVFSLDPACRGTPPPGHTHGCYFTEAQINKFLKGRGAVSYTDSARTSGHGTHTLGIAAGNGLGTGRGFPAGRYVGMAPQAGLIGVKLFDNRGFQVGEVAEALQFLIEEQARLGNPPLVVNMSFGHQLGAHDGSDPDEVLVDRLTDEGDANGITRVFVKSAGNAEQDGIYVRGTAVAGSPSEHTFKIPVFNVETNRSCGSIAGRGNDEFFADLWYKGNDEITVQITAPNGATFVRNSPGSDPNAPESDVEMDTRSGTIFIDCFPRNRVNGDRECWLGVDDTGGVLPAAGQWSVSITGQTLPEGGRYDIWIADATKGSCTWGWESPSAGSSVSIPGTSMRGITVGAYVTKTDWTNIAKKTIGYLDPNFVISDIAPFSSAGPTRDGRTKPDIAAPGMGIASTKARRVGTAAGSEGRARTVEDGQHMVLEGTSMSAPHVAGAAALLLSINPFLDAAMVQDILIDNAAMDNNTGVVPNPAWGFGKLDVFAAASDPRVGARMRPLPPGPPAPGP